MRETEEHRKSTLSPTLSLFIKHLLCTKVMQKVRSILRVMQKVGSILTGPGMLPLPHHHHSPIRDKRWGTISPSLEGKVVSQTHVTVQRLRLYLSSLGEPEANFTQHSGPRATGEFTLVTK